MAIEKLEPTQDSILVQSAKAAGAGFELFWGPSVQAATASATLGFNMMMCWMTPTSFSRKDDQ